jgi:hypothetical protein
MIVNERTATTAKFVMRIDLLGTVLGKNGEILGTRAAIRGCHPHSA